MEFVFEFLGNETNFSFTKRWNRLSPGGLAHVDWQPFTLTFTPMDTAHSQSGSRWVLHLDNNLLIVLLTMC